MRRHSERALPHRESGMCQSFTSVPRTYIRTADELEPLSFSARLASFPTLVPAACPRAESPICQLQRRFAQQDDAASRRMADHRTPPSQMPILPPKALPVGLPKSLRPSKLPPKNLDELDPLRQMAKEPGTGLLGKCVLCLLLNAVFVLALFLAFLIGHFAADAHFPQSNKTNTSNTAHLLPGEMPVADGTDIRGKTTAFDPRGMAPEHSDGTNIGTDGTQLWSQREEEFQKSLERRRQRVPSLSEVYPPLLDGGDPTADEADDPMPLSAATAANQFGNGPVMHRSAGIASQNVPLIPLPKTVMPRHYNVEIDLTEFHGLIGRPSQVHANVSILLEAFGNETAADDELAFHAGANIFIHRVQLLRQHAQHGKQRSGDGEVPIRSVKRHPEREMVRLLLGERMKPGWYWLEMELRSRICQSDTMPNGAALFGGFSTKFEPNFARTFLPGWDEPRFRTTFNVTIRHFSDAKVLTNTAPISSSPPAGTTCVTRFATTPPMPLYLLAFATGPFTGVEVRSSRANIPLTVWAAPQDMLAAHFVANFSPTMFERLQEDFGVKYPLSKMDIFLAPKLPVGGMENWGLVVLHADAVRISTSDGPLPLGTDDSSSSSRAASREERAREQKQHSLMLVDRRSEQYRAEKAITHELVHQWFGNLVGIWEWEELWIAEGFATYFVFDFLNAANHPHLTEHEYYLRLIELIQRQSTDGRSALVRPLRTAGQLYRLFDGIHLYTKGAVMVKMLKDLVGPAEFRAGITRFLRENSFKSVDRRAIWAAFPTVADHGVDPVRLKDAMEPWLVNRGVPEVEVQRNYEDQSVRLKQRSADQNRHIVYLDDEAMQQMRMNGQDEEDEETERTKKGAGRGAGDEEHDEEDVGEDGWKMKRMDGRDLKDADDQQDEEGGRTERVERSQRDEKDEEGDDGWKMKGRDEMIYEQGEEEDGGKMNDDANERWRMEKWEGKNYIDEEERRRKREGRNDQPEEEDWEIIRTGIKLKDDEHHSRRGQEAAEKDIDGILGWMADELDRNMTATSKPANVRTEDDGTISAEETTMASPPPTVAVSNGRMSIFGRRRGGRGPESRRKHHHYHRKKLLNAHRSKSFHQQQQQKKRRDRWKIADQQQRGRGVFSSSGYRMRKTGGGTVPVFSSWTAPSRRSNVDTDQRNVPVAFSVTNSGDGAESRQLKQSKTRSSRGDQQKRRADDAQLLGPLWPVPFSYSFGSAHSVRGQTVRQFWLLNETLRFVDVGLDRAQHMLANPHWVYAYRVNYDTQNWRMLIAQLHKNHQEIPTMSRMQLIVDGETFLRQSANTHYLAHEDDLGVLLVGLDALHALLELFSASDVFGTMLVHFVPVIRQLDRQLSLTAAHGTDPELAALWLLSPLRLAKLYQLRCAANLGTCAETKQVRRWLAHPTALAADNHQQLSALCQHLFAHAGPAEVALLSGLLKQFSAAQRRRHEQRHGDEGGTAFAAVIRQLCSACVQDEALVRQAVAEILRTRNVIVYSSALNSGYTVNYNRKFRELFWTGLTQQLNIHERQVLFAVNTGKSNRMARILLHSIRSLGELNLVERVVLHQWPESLRVELDYLRRKLSWTEREACEQIRKQLVLDPATKRGGEKDNRRRRRK
ncbi:hypothetical protein niasHT_033054 [Heterodera trifolii]|uniref:Aminopeptidase n=1 Tax=Heterodera trifolii TaxID=157864 RepID=A0ABD2IQ49_9BILA